MAQFLITTNSKVNLPPTRLGSNTFNINNRSNYVFTKNDFINTTPSYLDPDGDEPSFLKLITLPSLGVLNLNGIPCVLNQNISFIDIIANQLVYVSADQDALYNESFRFDIADEGSLLFSNLNINLLGTINLEVESYVNLQPSQIGNNSDTLEFNETKIFTINDFTVDTTPAYSDPEGDPAESLKITSLPAQGSLRFNNIGVIVNQVILFSDIALGKLTFIASGNQAGYNTAFSFEIADSGSKKFTA